ncbi:MAG TPA: MFS transporter [Candidatus Dormibacteraeota bacterium]
MTLRVLVLCGLAAALSAYGGSVLILALPAVALDFHAPVRELTNLGSVLSFGSVGALPLAALADRAGRRRMLALAVAGFSLAGLLSAWAPTVAWLAVGRVLGVCFEALAASIATALVVEAIPAGRRGLAVSILTLAAGAGIAVTTIAYPLVVPHWRWLYLGAGAGLLAVPALLAWLPESRAWRPLGASGSVMHALLEPPFRDRLLLVAGYVALYAVFVEPAGLLVVFFGSRLGLLPPELSAVVVASGIVGALCFAPGGWLSDRFGRRRPAVALTVLTAIAGGLAFAGSSRAAYWAFNIAWSGLASALAPVAGAWFGELFPTRARATSESVLTVSAAVGAVAGLQLAGGLEPALGLGRALAACALVTLVSAALLLRLPETRGLPLPR